MAIAIQNKTALRVGFFAIKKDHPKDSLTIVAKGTFDLATGGAVTPCAEQPLLSGDRYEDEDRTSGLAYPSDFTPWKPRADILVRGTCRTPRGEPRTAARVAVRVGAWEKELAVVGDRVWERGSHGGLVASRPKSFTEMPLTWARSFGGARNEYNPIGRGGDEPQPGQPLPNLERFGRPTVSPDQENAPFGLAPIDRLWRERTSKVGTYDARWRAERWPWFPADFDWGYFNAAPRDQQIEGYLRGDEPLVWEGFSAETQRSEARLPGLRVRAFVQKNVGGRIAVEEVRMSLDTVLLDVDANAVTLVWRGLAPVASKHFSEVTALLLVAEDLAAAPHPLAHYEDPAMWARSTPDEAMLAEEEEAAARAVDADTREPADEAAMIAEARAMLVQGNLPAPLLAKLDRAQSVDTFLAILEEISPTPQEELVEKAAADATRGARGAMDSAGMSLDSLEEEATAPTTVRVRLDRLEVERRLACDEGLEETDLSGLDLRGLDLSGRDLTRTRFTGADLTGGLLMGSLLTGARLDRAKLDGADLSGANLGEASLVYASLVGAKLDASDASAASFARAVLDRVSAMGAVFGGARFGAASLVSANLSDTLLAGADLVEANLDGAILDRADLSGADLSRASLQRANLEQTLLERAKLIEAMLEGANARRAGLRAADLTRARLAGAALPSANLSHAKLDHADLRGATLTGTKLESVIAEAACFDAADLRGARLSNAFLVGASFVEVDAGASVWTGADLSRCNLERARLIRAELSEADLGGANLDLAVLKEATLTRAKLVGTKLRRVNLFRAQLEGADLSQADCRASNLFESELLDAVLHGTRLEKTNLMRTKLDPRYSA